jgi:hypothetical protein
MHRMYDLTIYRLLQKTPHQLSSLMKSMPLAQSDMSLHQVENEKFNGPC